jgi:hypothetical protein
MAEAKLGPLIGFDLDAEISARVPADILSVPKEAAAKFSSEQEKPEAQIVPHDDLVWRRAAQIQQETADGRAWRAARDAALKQPLRPSPVRRVVSGDPVVFAPEPIPNVGSRMPARRMVRLAQPAVNRMPLRAPLRIYAIDADGPRLIWWQGLGDAVAYVFDRWRALDNPENPDAWA